MQTQFMYIEAYAFLNWRTSYY